MVISGGGSTGLRQLQQPTTPARKPIKVSRKTALYSRPDSNMKGSLRCKPVRMAFSAAFMFSTNSIRKLKEKRWQAGEAREGLPKRKSSPRINTDETRIRRAFVFH